MGKTSEARKYFEASAGIRSSVDGTLPEPNAIFLSASTREFESETARFAGVRGNLRLFLSRSQWGHSGHSGDSQWSQWGQSTSIRVVTVEWSQWGQSTSIRVVTVGTEHINNDRNAFEYATKPPRGC
jgi:hypothetical protein